MSAYLAMIHSMTQSLILATRSLRLAMYRGLGFDPIVDEDGQVVKHVVRE